MDCDVLVIGAGMTGLSAGQRLREQGRRVLVLEKARSAGGRMATRRIGPGRADHGAQFLTAHTPAFAAALAGWEAAGLIYPWTAGYARGSLRPSADATFYPRYAAVNGMNHLAQQLAQGLEVRTAVTVQAVRRLAHGWQVEDSAGGSTQASQVLLTAPAPQSLALLAAGEVALSTADQAALAVIAYDPCLVGLFWWQGAALLPPVGALLRSQHDPFWIADNQQKGISPEATLLTVQSSAAFSRRWWEADDAAALTAIQAGLQEFLDPQGRLVEAQLKRWRFATASTLCPQPFLLPAGLPGLALAGDAFDAAGSKVGSVESAFISGQQVAAALT